MATPSGSLYAIGGLICGQIKEQYGMDKLLDLLKLGNTNSDYYQIIETYLGVDQQSLDQYIKTTVAALPELSAEEMRRLAY